MTARTASDVFDEIRRLGALHDDLLELHAEDRDVRDAQAIARVRGIIRDETTKRWAEFNALGGHKARKAA